MAHPNAKRIYQFIHSINEYAENLQNPPVQKQMCGAGDGFWVFDTDGRFYPCHMLSPLVLNTERLRGLKETRIGCGQTDFADIRCRGCPFVTDCPTCIGCNFIYRDSFRRRDFTHCWIMEAEVRATMRMEILRLKKTKQLTSEDERLIRSINTVNAFLNG